MDRRQFLSVTTVTGTTLLAGCGASTDSTGTATDDGTPGDSTGTATDDGTPGDSTETATDETDGSTTGSFRLLISDRPAAIGDFDSLDVTFDSARVHKRNTDDEQTETAESTATEGGAETEQTATAEQTETANGDDETADEGDDETADEGDETESKRGFTLFDLDEPTVDLTQVVGEKAIGVLDGKLETGQYSKIELYVSAVDGIVDGESVPVKVPSNKLQITKPFEITADGTVEFVFDINVVKKGRGGYNLLPVISESGVAGEDVDVEEVGADDEQTTEKGAEANESESQTTESETETSASETEATENGAETTERDPETAESSTTATDA